MRGVRTRSDAIIGIEIADRKTGLAAVVDQRNPAAGGPGLALGVVNLAALARLCGQFGRFVEMAFFDFMLGEVEQVAANVGGIDIAARARVAGLRSEEHTSELRHLMRTSYAVF